MDGSYMSVDSPRVMESSHYDCPVSMLSERFELRAASRLKFWPTYPNRSPLADKGSGGVGVFV